MVEFIQRVHEVVPGSFNTWTRELNSDAQAASRQQQVSAQSEKSRRGCVYIVERCAAVDLCSNGAEHLMIVCMASVHDGLEVS